MEGDSLSDILNIITALVFLYCLFAIPIGVLTRLNRMRKGEVVSPMTLIISKVLKYWFISALILIPVSIVVTYMNFTSAGASEDAMISNIMLYSIIGNIFTSLFFGIAYTIGSKKKWSYSSKEN